ncbi:hypothetical protein O1611_g8199 [Lasiodiplodia mahajangana]|uniref:Uncharacterized protein n=1 Tax=Lasiodiplodia mahajangana TaxID=1108764 RepID=A0ACC2JDZ8_9PEZI|nr:hypothetical protein O1611_g8199 [Lasiodiplodia mahajangana]
MADSCSILADQTDPAIPPQTDETPRTPLTTRLPTAAHPIAPNSLKMEKSDLRLPLTQTCVRLDGLQAKYQELQGEYRNAKRKLSEVFEASGNEISKLNHTKKLGNKGAREHKRLVYKALRAKYNAYVKGLQKVRDLLSRCLKELVRNHVLGNLSLIRKEFKVHINTLERQITIAIKRGVIAQASIHAVRRAMVDDAINGTVPKKLLLGNEIVAEENIKWAYVDQLIRFRNPKATIHSLSNYVRDKHSQQRFRAQVMKEYGAIRNQSVEMDCKELAWCVVSGAFHPKHLVIAAHIVGYNLGAASANYIFGQAGKTLRNGHLMSPQNGLPMLQAYEELLDNGTIIFEPVDEDAITWKVIVLDQCLRDTPVTQSALPGAPGPIPWGRGLHKRELSFANSFRPSKQYMYFAYCINIFRRQRLEVPCYVIGVSGHGRSGHRRSPTPTVATTTHHDPFFLALQSHSRSYSDPLFCTLAYMCDPFTPLRTAQ